MPGFLRFIFKPSGSRTHTSQPRTNTGDFSPTELSPGAKSLSTTEMDELAEKLRSQLAGSGGGSQNRRSRSLRDLLNLSGTRSEEPQHGMTRQMLDVLESVSDERRRERVTPFPRSSSSGLEHGDDVDHGWEKSPRAPLRESARSSRTDIWDQAYQACGEAVSAAESAQRGVESEGERAMLGRCTAVLVAQRAELIDMRPFAGGRRAPTLATLSQIYEKAASDLRKIRNAPGETAGRDRIATILHVLAEGPDYLLDIALIEAIIWQAEVIDSSFGAGIWEILNKAVRDQPDLVTFRRAAESIVAATTTLPKKLLDDELSKDAYRAIGTLVRQLQARVAASRQPSEESESSTSLLAVSSSGGPTSREPTVPPSGANTPLSASPAVSPPASRSTSPAPSLSGEMERLAIPDLQARYGTGPTTSLSPTPSTSARPTPTPTASAPASVSATPTPQRSAAPSPPASPGSPDSEKSIWEYRGHLLTRSALELVMRQEALAMADSSGQYAGEVSWDDVRNAWIPSWAEKLKSHELAEGEIPSTNPADFKYRKADAWGNKIGWYNGRMFYEEDPTFDLK